MCYVIHHTSRLNHACVPTIPHLRCFFTPFLQTYNPMQVWYESAIPCEGRDRPASRPNPPVSTERLSFSEGPHAPSRPMQPFEKRKFFSAGSHATLRRHHRSRIEFLQEQAVWTSGRANRVWTSRRLGLAHRKRLVDSGRAYAGDV